MRNDVDLEKEIKDECQSDGTMSRAFALQPNRLQFGHPIWSS